MRIDIVIRATHSNTMSSQPLDRSLPTLAWQNYLSESRSSPEMNVSGSSSYLDAPAHAIASYFELGTPPPDPEFDSQRIDGIGSLFSATLPLRAGSLKMSGQDAGVAASTPPSALKRPDPAEDGDVSTTEDEPGTPQADEFFSERHSTPAMSRGKLSGVPPLLTPSPAPNRKRMSSPPSAPRRAKRLKSQTQEGRRELESEACPEEACWAQSVPEAFRNARQLTVDLAATTQRSLEEFEPSCQLLSLPRSQVPVNGLANRSSATLPFSIEVEYFSEDEIEQDLAELLSAYRAFYLEPDVAETWQPRNPSKARNSRRILKAIFESQLNSAEEEGLLLQEEEEDVLDTFLTWVQGMQRQSVVDKENFKDLAECLNRLDGLRTVPFIKRLVVTARTWDGALFTVQLANVARSYQLESATAWELGEIFRDLEAVDIA
ncbi:hypothetical protein VTI74DRAFT_10508 [Chaetomium olivicolor]